MNASLLTADIRAILLDIEGTTTPIPFVHEVLFGFARSQVREYLLEHSGSPEVRSDLAKLREEQAMDVTQSLQPPPLVGGGGDAEIDSIAAYVNWLIDRDRKSTGLKSLQGKIWKQGYVDGTLKSQVFSDVEPALERWHREGLKISIFSSGSALAQKLLFAYTEAGDLSGFISNYFDTAVGSKTDVQSYRQIAAALGLAPGEVVFISDVVAELDAAASADMKTLLCVRPGNEPQGFPARHQILQSFDEISTKNN